MRRNDDTGRLPQDGAAMAWLLAQTSLARLQHLERLGEIMASLDVYGKIIAPPDVCGEMMAHRKTIMAP